MKICVFFGITDDGELLCPYDYTNCIPEPCPNYIPSDEDELDPELVRLTLDSFLASN